MKLKADQIFQETLRAQITDEFKRRKKPAPTTAGWWRVNSIEWECTHCGEQLKLKLGEDKPPVCPKCGGMKTNWMWQPQNLSG